MLKRFATVLLLLTVAGAQDVRKVVMPFEPETTTGISRKSVVTGGSPSGERANEFETHYAIKPDHHKRNFWIAFGLTSAATSAFVIWKMRQPHCNHYEYGQSGVGMPCPIEPKSDAK